MPTLKHLLVPSDGSEGALNAAALAGEFARALGAKITVLHVLDDRMVVPEAWAAGVGLAAAAAPVGNIEEARASLEERSKNDEVARTVAAVGETPGEVDSALRWGHPVRVICDYAGEVGADLIVMGSHGRSAIARAVLGSVSHAVVNAAPCAVTIVR